MKTFEMEDKSGGLHSLKVQGQIILYVLDGNAVAMNPLQARLLATALNQMADEIEGEGKQE